MVALPCALHAPTPSPSPVPAHVLRPLRPPKPPARVSTGRWGRKRAAPRAPWEVLFPWPLHQPEPMATTTPAEASSPSPSPPETAPATTVVRDFYDGINRRDLASVALLISDSCVYEDLIFSRPFVGRQAILEFFRKFTESISSDLQFVIDDISNEDSLAIGVTWHLGTDGNRQ